MDVIVGYCDHCCKAISARSVLVMQFWTGEIVCWPCHVREDLKGS